MDKLIEEKCIKSFVIKEKRDRILYELSNPRKRNNGIQNLFSNLDKKYAVLDETNISEKDLLEVIKKYFDINKKCYVLADRESEDDGKIMPFKEALKHMLEYEIYYAIVCGENMLIMSDELCYGSPEKIILYRQ